MLMRFRASGDRCHVGGLSAALLAGALLLGACGTAPKTVDVSAVRPQSPSSVALCHVMRPVDRLVVRRSDAFPSNHVHFSFPRAVTVASPRRIRGAARALCALPRLPKGAFHCPVDLGIDYALTFTAKGSAGLTVGVDATGCETVTGLGATRWVARTPGFWVKLGKAMGLRHPDYATFRGSSPNG
jgi:hypothetical protein